MARRSFTFPASTNLQSAAADTRSDLVVAFSNFDGRVQDLDGLRGDDCVSRIYSAAQLTGALVSKTDEPCFDWRTTS